MAGRAMTSTPLTRKARGGGGLADRLQDVIARLPELRRHGFAAVAARYDWSRLAAQYDAEFERIAIRSHPGDVIQ